MHVFHSFEEIPTPPHAVIALGTFDGVHRGHQEVMQKAIAKARNTGTTSMVVTFAAHPFSVLCPEREPLRLATIPQKVRYIAEQGIDSLVLLPMTKTLIHQSPHEFCEHIRCYIAPQAIVVGENFTYGAKAAGNTATLRETFAINHTPVCVLPLLGSPGKTAPISSTVIRKAVSLGHMEMAATLLGRAYELESEVVPGDHRGRTIGFPTANMYIPPQMALPPDGVYVTEAEWDGITHQGMTNIGDNPTFTEQYRRIETHVFDWHGDLYGKRVRLRFYKRLRHELKFDTPDALVRQMHEDRLHTLAYFSDKHI